MSDDSQATGQAEATEADALPPEEAFAVLADETRVAIVRALADADGQTLGFNELRKRVGAKDSSGFNYHLRKLVGRFVRQVEEGYELTTAGSQVYGAILSGTYTDSVDLDPIELTDPEDVCPTCGAALVATYEEEKMAIQCRDCDRVVARSSLPPAAVEGRDPADLPAAFGRYLQAMLVRTRSGFCSLCSGPMTGRLHYGAVPAFDVEEKIPLAVYECERCFETLQASPGAAVLSHPAVVTFLHERGVDVREVPPWRLDMLDEEATTLESEDPLRVAVDVMADGDRLTVTIDADLAVVDTDLTLASA